MQSPLRDWKLDPEACAVLRLLARGMHVNAVGPCTHTAALNLLGAS
jgi:hypothetical protein